MIIDIPIGEKNMADFGNYLKELRLKRGLGVNQLGTMSGVSPSLISKVENGKRGAPKASTLDELSKVLKVDQMEMHFMAGFSSIIQVDPNFKFSNIAYENMTEKDLSIIKDYKNKNYKYRQDIRDVLKEEPPNILGEKIKELMKQNGIDSQELAKELNLASYVIVNILSGDYSPDYQLVNVLADYFKVTSDYLLGRDAEDNKFEYYKNKIITEFPNIDLMFHDMESLTAEDLQDVYEFIKFKKSQQK